MRWELEGSRLRVLGLARRVHELRHGKLIEIYMPLFQKRKLLDTNHRLAKPSQRNIPGGLAVTRAETFYAVGLRLLFASMTCVDILEGGSKWMLKKVSKFI